MKYIIHNHMLLYYHTKYSLGQLRGWDIYTWKYMIVHSTLALRKQKEKEGKLK